jgi:hypothetical protein
MCGCSICSSTVIVWSTRYFCFSNFFFFKMKYQKIFIIGIIIICLWKMDLPRLSAAEWMK